MSVINKTKTNKRTVYKHIVDSSFSAEQDWARVDEPLSTEFLTDLCTILKPIGDHRRETGSVPRRTKKRKITAAAATTSTVKSEHLKQLEDCCFYGLTACNRALESEIRRAEAPAATDSDKLVEVAAVPDVVFVCKEDLTSELLYDHFPALCVLASKPNPGLRLVPLARSAETALGKVLGLPRVGCVALKDHVLTRNLLERVREHVPPPTSQILIDAGHYRETKIKTLITTTPITSKAKPQVKEDKT